MGGRRYWEGRYWGGRLYGSVLVPYHPSSGLCGDFDYNPDNDFMNTFGDRVDDPITMANSWSSDVSSRSFCYTVKQVKSSSKSRQSKPGLIPIIYIYASTKKSFLRNPAQTMLLNNQLRVRRGVSACHKLNWIANSSRYKWEIFCVSSKTNFGEGFWKLHPVRRILYIFKTRLFELMST